RFVDDMVVAGEAADRLQVNVGNRVHDPSVHFGRRALSVHRARGIPHVVPDDIVGVGRKSRGDVMCVLGREVTLDEIHLSSMLGGVLGAAALYADRVARSEALVKEASRRAMERTGIEPVTSGLQIQSYAGLGASVEVATARLRELCRES